PQVFAGPAVLPRRRVGGDEQVAGTKGVCGSESFHVVGVFAAEAGDVPVEGPFVEAGDVCLLRPGEHFEHRLFVDLERNVQLVGEWPLVSPLLEEPAGIDPALLVGGHPETGSRGSANGAVVENRHSVDRRDDEEVVVEEEEWVGDVGVLAGADDVLRGVAVLRFVLTDEQVVDLVDPVGSVTDDPDAPMVEVAEGPEGPSQPWAAAGTDDVDDIGRGGTKPPLPIFLVGQLDPSSDTAANASGSGTANATRSSARMATRRSVNSVECDSDARSDTPARRYRVAPSRKLPTNTVPAGNAVVMAVGKPQMVRLVCWDAGPSR